MLIKHGRTKYQLSNSSQYVAAIIRLARAATEDINGEPPPSRNDVKQLWRELGKNHQQLLTQVAKRPGIPQADLEGALGLDWLGLRGVRNGLSRICERVGVEHPVRAMGYNNANRRYTMDSDVAATIKRLT